HNDRASASGRGPFRAYPGVGVGCWMLDVGYSGKPTQHLRPNTEHPEQSDMSLSWAWPLLDESAEFERGAAAMERAPAAVWVEGRGGRGRGSGGGAGAARLRAPLLILPASEEAAEMALDDLSGIGFRLDEIGLFPSVDAADDEPLPGAKVLASSEAPERRAVARTRLAGVEGPSPGARA